MLFNINELNRLNTKNVRKELYRNGYNDIDLCRYYITGFKSIKSPVNSDLRKGDNNASLHIKIINNTAIISDFGYKTGMSIFKYIQEKYFDNSKEGYLKVLDLVRNDFKLKNLRVYDTTLKYSKRIKKKPIKYNTPLIDNKNIIINIKPKKWDKQSLEYWKQYNLTPTDFKFSNIIIKPISKFRIINEDINTISEINSINNLMFAYCVFYNYKWHYKIYNPLGVNGKGKFKWVSNINSSYIVGKRPPINNDLLIIQSSIKDKVLIEKMGYYSLSLLAEGIWFNDKDWKAIRKFFKKIILFANNDWEKKDNPGLELAKTHFKNYDIDNIITTPNNLKGVSDISDYTKKYNYEKAKKFVSLLINQVK